MLLLTSTIACVYVLAVTVRVSLSTDERTLVDEVGLCLKMYETCFTFCNVLYKFVVNPTFHLT